MINIEIANPPMMIHDIPFLIPEPWSDVRAMGSIPGIIANEVINIGRSLYPLQPELHLQPIFQVNWVVKSTTSMAFFNTRSSNMIMPMIKKY